jgi:uncharacterized membrane protein YvbJ
MELSVKEYIAISITFILCIILFLRIYDKCRRSNPNT